MVAGESAFEHQGSDAAFDDPAFLSWGEAGFSGGKADSGDESDADLGGFVHGLLLEALVDEADGYAGMSGLGLGEERLGVVVIGDVRCGDADGEDETEYVGRSRASSRRSFCPGRRPGHGRVR